MSRLVDIRETISGSNVISYSYGRSKGSAGKTLSMTVAGMIDSVRPGDLMTVKGIEYVVTSKDHEAAAKGFTTIFKLAEKVAADLVKLTPKKALMFMSLTEEEKEEFEIANMDALGVVDLSNLDYTPLMRVCSPEDFTGGWMSSTGDPETGVIDYLAREIGMNLVMNVRPYWIRQVHADVTTPFYEVILSLVSFLNPIVTIEGDTLFILQKPARGGVVSFGKIAEAAQSETFNYNNQCGYVKVVGGLGKWDRDKVKGNAEAEKEVTITNTVGKETGQQIWARFGGGPKDVAMMMGKRGQVALHWEGGPTDMSDTTTTTETWLVDPFGNFKALLRKTQVTHNLVLGEDTFRSEEKYEYDFLPECFERPRLVRKLSTIGKYQWELSMFPGGCMRRFKDDTDEIAESWLYSPNGTLLHESMVRKSTCIVLQSGGIYADETVMELTFGDNVWTPDGQKDPNVQMRVVEESATRYRQLTPTMYQKSTYHRNIGALRRSLGDGQHSVSSEQIRGRVPKSPSRYRTLQVYAERITADDPMSVPALIVSNSNIIDWSDAEAILQDIINGTVDFDYTVERTYTLPMELEVDIGWAVEFPDVKLGLDGVMKSVEVVDGHISAFNVTKDAGNGSAMTSVVIEGKVRLL